MIRRLIGVVALAIPLLSTCCAPAIAGYGKSTEIAPNVFCFPYTEGRKDIENQYQHILGAFYIEGGDVLLDKEEYDGYRRVLIMTDGKNRHEFRWRGGTYCQKVVPLGRRS